MSKRFGRNQKRVLREAVARANNQVADKEAAIFMQKAVLEKYRDDANDHHDFMRVLATRLSRYAMAAGVPVKSGIRAYAEQTTVWMDTTDFAEACPDFGVSSVSAQIQMQNEILDLLYVDAVRTVMKQEVHCMVQIGEKKFAYAIGQRALRNMTLIELRASLVPQITDQLIDAIYKAR
jgi:hypothetical protein